MAFKALSFILAVALAGCVLSQSQKQWDDQHGQNGTIGVSPSGRGGGR
jgi:hypothetical protein